MLVGFDGHMNLLLRGVNEEYVVRLRAERSKLVQKWVLPGMPRAHASPACYIFPECRCAASAAHFPEGFLYLYTAGCAPLLTSSR